NTMLLVSTIVSLAHSLGLRVVAEGVDSERQADVLRGLKCDEMQGYLMSRPVPPHELEAVLRDVAAYNSRTPTAHRHHR
ncbi:MAG: EAL domain-containing protein, partial [Betaproteobacteria bacterium]|nr:EAL domain-containing protein [Betaproteobacteria bacterium]